MSSRTQSFPLKWHLLLLVAGTLLPVLAFAAVTVSQLSRRERLSAERRLTLAAQNLATTVDREISSTTRVLQTLAESEYLDDGNLRSFALQARRVVQTQPTWMAVILLAPNGQQLVNTGIPLGQSLPNVNEPESLQHLVETHRPTVGNLARGHRKKRWAFPVRVPVMREGRLRYVLSAVMLPQTLVNVIQSQASADGEWTRTVVDARGTVVARSRDPLRFIGQRASPEYLQQIRAADDGIFHSTTLDNVHVLTTFHRLDVAHWAASVSVPIDHLEAPAHRLMSLVFGVGLTMLLLSGIAAYLLARRISSSIVSAAFAAEGLVAGKRPGIRHAGIREVDVLEKALQASAQLLSVRERERNEHLAHAEAARIEAEAARDEAQRANLLKDYFLAAVSHEIRSPLTPILGLANLLRIEQLDAQVRADSLETIERNARALNKLVDDLLDISRLTSGKLYLDSQPVELASVISNAEAMVCDSARAKHIQLKKEINVPGVVSGDADRLQQIVVNLLSNAVKFTPEGGNVTIRLEETQIAQQECVVLQVADTGIGIEAEFLPSVFERFRQADGSSRRKFGGLGLGLAIVHDLVELHGGTVKAASDGAEKGAVFTVTFPRLPNSQANGSRLVASTRTESLNGADS